MSQKSKTSGVLPPWCYKNMLAQWGEWVCVFKNFQEENYEARAANFKKKPWRSLAPSIVGVFEKERTRFGPKSEKLFGVRNWLCGVSACENMQKRVSHGETVRVGSSDEALRAEFKKKGRRRETGKVER